ncbi:MAG: hypothetical protein WCT04_19690 [Planctomycetota bacterium]
MSDPNEVLLVKQQKYRAQRIDHDYHKKPHAWRTWMRILTFVLPIAAIGALVVLTFVKNERHIYEPGPVSSRHIWFSHRCDDCHESKGGKLGEVTNAKCSKCHDGSIHNPNQVCPGGEKLIRNETFSPSGFGKLTGTRKVELQEPRCASCHTEHKGNQQLVAMSDNHCTQCHADLKTLNGKPAPYGNIRSFMDGHENWRVMRPDAKSPEGNDPTQLRFNHAKHMTVSYDSFSKFGARKMECVDCHRTSENNLEAMKPDSERLDEFEKLLTPDEGKTFYSNIKVRAEATGVVKYKLDDIDVRRILVETLSRDTFDRTRQKLAANPAQLKLTVENAAIATIRDLFGSLAASGQNRYMIPVTYEKNCASECHKHEIKAAGIIIPHGPAGEARDFLKSALYPEIVKSSLGGASMTDADKAKMKLLSKYRADLLKASGKPLPATKKEADELLITAAVGDYEKMFELMKASYGSEEEMAKAIDGIDADALKGSEKLKGKKKEKFNDELADAIRSLIPKFVDDKPISAAAIDTALDDKLKEGLGKIFGDAKTVRNNNERGACLFCHEPTTKKADKPQNDDVVADTNVPIRWLNHAVFNHETHGVVKCEECHATARTSEKTSQVLLPSMQQCQICHKPGNARSDCIECHIYHDKTHSKQDRAVTIEYLMSESNSSNHDVKAAPGATKAEAKPAATPETKKDATPEAKK